MERTSLANSIKICQFSVALGKVTDITSKTRLETSDKSRGLSLRNFGAEIIRKAAACLYKTVTLRKDSHCSLKPTVEFGLESLKVHFFIVVSVLWFI